jgi:hypothetical protein
MENSQILFQLFLLFNIPLNPIQSLDTLRLN